MKKHPGKVNEPELIYISAGEFLMGSDPKKDKGARNDERPQHRVYLPDYAISKYPVTNAQYEAFVRATGSDSPEYWEDKRAPGGKEDHPVVCVAWDDVMAFCRWLADVTDKPYDLPSEAEWAKAARGTDGGQYPWGAEVPTAELCNFDDNIGDTTPVGQYSPQGDSPYGCVDMAGNVWEWTRSLYKRYPYKPDDGREDLEARICRVIRGGAFNYPGRNLRCACRLNLRPYNKFNFTGFRVVRRLI